jgi:hypothetical protein
VGVGEGVLHGAADVFVVLFRNRDICAVPDLLGVAAVGGEYNVVGVKRVIGVEVELF